MTLGASARAASIAQLGGERRELVEASATPR